MHHFVSKFLYTSYILKSYIVIAQNVIVLVNCIGDGGVRKCCVLSIDKCTLLGRNVAFSFTPDTYDPNAILEQQREDGTDQWQTLLSNNKITQYDSDESDDEKYNRVHYYNETIHCWMNAGILKLELEGIVE
jgi:hypothetical protein